MFEEYWTYGNLYGRTDRIFKIKESNVPIGIHAAAQLLMDIRKYSVSQAYEYLNNLRHI